MSKKYKVMSEVLNNLESELNKLEDMCEKCHGNTMDDCMYCKYDDKKISLRNQIKETKKVFNMEKESNDDFIIYASDARNMTNEECKKDKKLLKPIMNKIREAIKNKKFECYIDGTTPNYVISKLHDLGYKTKLEQGSPCARDVYKISW